VTTTIVKLNWPICSGHLPESLPSVSLTVAPLILLRRWSSGRSKCFKLSRAGVHRFIYRCYTQLAGTPGLYLRWSWSKSNLPITKAPLFTAYSCSLSTVSRRALEASPFLATAASCPGTTGQSPSVRILLQHSSQQHGMTDGENSSGLGVRSWGELLHWAVSSAHNPNQHDRFPSSVRLLKDSLNVRPIAIASTDFICVSHRV